MSRVAFGLLVFVFAALVMGCTRAERYTAPPASVAFQLKLGTAHAPHAAELRVGPAAAPSRVHAGFSATSISAISICHGSSHCSSALRLLLRSMTSADDLDLEDENAMAWDDDDVSDPPAPDQDAWDRPRSDALRPREASLRHAEGDSRTLIGPSGGHRRVTDPPPRA